MRCAGTGSRNPTAQARKTLSISHPSAQPVDPIAHQAVNDAIPIHARDGSLRGGFKLRPRRRREVPWGGASEDSRVQTENAQQLRRQIKGPLRHRFDERVLVGRQEDAGVFQQQPFVDDQADAVAPAVLLPLPSSGTWTFIGRKPMLLPWSKPAWMSANTLSGGQASPARPRFAAAAGYCVFALMPTRSPSLTRLPPQRFADRRQPVRMAERHERVRPGTAVVHALWRRRPRRCGPCSRSKSRTRRCVRRGSPRSSASV